MALPPDALIPWSALTRLARDLLAGHGADAEQAQVVAKVLSWCDAAGRHNQGVWRLPILTKRLRDGGFRCPCAPVYEQKASALYAMDGDGGMGHYLAVRAMERAIEAAKQHGSGAVAVRNSNFFGAAGYYVDQAARAGCVGLCFSNSFPKVAAFGGRAPVLGTNPLAMGAPRGDGESLIVDMATSAAAGSTVTRAVERGEPLAEGMAIDRQGNPITDPSAVAAGALLPFGGAKGYGLALMVEVLAGVLTGAAFSHGVRSMVQQTSESGQNGQLFIALDIAKLMPLDAFCARLSMLAEQLGASGETHSSPNLPGETRWRHLRAARSDGIALDPKTRQVLATLAAAVEVQLPWAAVDNEARVP